MRVKNIKPYYAIINRVLILFMVLLICSHKTAVGAESNYLTLLMPKKFIPALQADGTVQYIPGADIEKQIRTVSPALKISTMRLSPLQLPILLIFLFPHDRMSRVLS